MRFDGSAVTANEIVDAIKNDAGYEASLESEEDEEEDLAEFVEPILQATAPKAENAPESPVGQSQIAILEIEGMHCSSCANLIEKSLKKVPGVVEASVNFASEKARVKLDANADASVLEKAVADAGYAAKVQKT